MHHRRSYHISHSISSRRALQCDPVTLREMIATNSTSYKKSYRDVVNQKDCVEVVLRALNRYADISQEPPAYLETLGKTERITNVDDFLASITAKRGKVNLVELIRKCNFGDLGGLIFTGYTGTNLERVQDLHVHSPIIYKNEFAKTLEEYGKDPASIMHDPRLENHRPSLY